MKVYILSMYQEEGADNVRATTDPAKVMALLEQYPNVTPAERGRLSDLLQKNCLSTNGESVSDVWGGIMLHIVDLV